MRRWSDYAMAEWASGWPVRHALKEWRNDWMCAVYIRRPALDESPSLPTLARRTPENLALVVAFEQPWYIEWQLEMARRHQPGWVFLVLDNSRSDGARQAIRQICRQAGTPYVGLPSNPTRHANRSHSLAMQWAFERVVRALRPGRFGFFDHDLIPVAPVDLASRLRDQPCYGMLVESRWAWQLWAGYCLFEFQKVVELPLNFLYDFANGLDTGGRNYGPLYRHLDRRRMRFASSTLRPVPVPGVADAAAAVQMLDEGWLHVGGVSYNGNADRKRAWVEQLHQQHTQAAGRSTP